MLVLENVWNEMRNLTTAIDRERDTIKRIVLRSNRVRSFFDLLRTMFQATSDQAAKRGLSAEWCKNPFDTTQMNNELTRVANSAKKNYGGRH